MDSTDERALDALIESLSRFRTAGFVDVTEVAGGAAEGPPPPDRMRKGDRRVGRHRRSRAEPAQVPDGDAAHVR